MSVLRLLLYLAVGSVAGLAVGGAAGWLAGTAYLKWMAPKGAEPAGTGTAAFLIMSLVMIAGGISGAAAGFVLWRR